FDECREHAARSPNRSLVDYPQRLHEFCGGGGFVDITLRTRCQGLQNRLIVGATAGHDDAQVGAGGLKAGHHVEKVSAIAAAEQSDIGVLVTGYVAERRSNEFEVGLVVEERAKSNESERIAFHDSDADFRFLCRGRFHYVFPSGTCVAYP